MINADTKKQICLNNKCPDFGRKNKGYIIKKGFNAKGIQMFKCKTCGVRFPATKGTVFYNRHLSEDKIILVCKLLVEKNGIRAMERITENHRDTISSLVSDLAGHAREVTNFLIKNIDLTQVQVDEMWSFIKKNKRTLSKEMLTEIDMAIAGFI